LKREGITVFARAAAGTSGMENIYFTKDRDKRVCKPLGFAGAFEEDEIPDVEAKTFFVIPILAGEVNLSLLRKLSKKARIALDAQGFVRFAEGERVVFKDWPEKEEGLPCLCRRSVLRGPISAEGDSWEDRTRRYLFRHLRGRETLYRCRTGQSLCGGGHLPQDGGPRPVHGNHEERGDVSEEFIDLTREVNTPSKWSNCC
jgi:hypothetical protein